MALWTSVHGPFFLPSFLKGRGALERTSFLVCRSLIVFVAFEPEQTDCPPFSGKLSYELFELFVTELKFLDRN